MTSTTLQTLPTVTASFAASFVEFVEALTVVLAVGATRNWRSALVGSGAAALLLGILVLFLGPLLAILRLEAMQLVVGALLLLFGLRWLRKAILRGAGVLPLHDEAQLFATETARLGGDIAPVRDSTMASSRGSGWDTLGLATAFQITLLEGIEVVFVVVAVGAGRADLLRAASLGAGLALLTVVALGVVLHRPLTRIPENAMKFVVGAMLCAFGTFWLGEGSGIAWPGGDWALLALSLGFLAVGLAAVPACAARGRTAAGTCGPVASGNEP